MNKVFVQVTGVTGAGKSTVAHIIEEALQNANVSFSYDDEHEVLAAEREQIRGFRTLEKAKEIASEHVEVVIQERQMHREAAMKLSSG